ncbi:fimbrial protein [Aeromonas sp. HMWF014]|uniref:fimbrial protein n=1 Tax=Aeromonas sp. HMWF014 TaxID=2056850 RepID=UPI000D349482|nr:fimbrial protein [Aeromonas sp. HMWF014]PTT55686.1 hypothetical protein DBR19_02045 [Aeromonas sp. HMWF014]
MRKLYHFGVKLSPLWHRALLLAMLPGVLATSLPASADDNVTLTISGTLRKTSCQLNPQDATIMVDFKTINSRDLELAETPVMPFTVRLQQCDISPGEATVTISGTTSAHNTGHLALADSSTAKGFSIGFKVGQVPTMADLLLGVPSAPLALSSGDTTLHFGAYARRELNTQLVEGRFEATATLNINYL